MALINFQERFAGLVESGAKTQTIRTRWFPKSERLYLYTGLRTKRARKLGIGICVRDSEPITIDLNEGTVFLWGGELFGTQLDALARADGFLDWQDMIAWFRKTYIQGRSVLVAYMTTWVLASLDPTTPQEGAE